MKVYKYYTDTSMVFKSYTIFDALVSTLLFDRLDLIKYLEVEYES
jgi:hypothetical protein